MLRIKDMQPTLSQVSLHVSAGPDCLEKQADMGLTCHIPAGNFSSFSIAPDKTLFPLKA